MTKTIYDITQRRDVVRTYENGICPTLNQMMGTGGNNVPIIETVFRDHSFGSKVEDSVAGTIRAQGGAKNGSENLVLSSAHTNATITKNKAPAIMACQPAIVVGALSAHEGRSMQDSQAVDAGHVLEHPKPVGALGCGASVSNQLVDQSHVIPTKLQGVRRLTPRECERLQGLPDDYTLIDHKSCSDSARYKALGNGMAQPCADYVMSVVVKMLSEEEEK